MKGLEFYRTGNYYTAQKLLETDFTNTIKNHDSLAALFNIYMNTGNAIKIILAWDRIPKQLKHKFKYQHIEALLAEDRINDAKNSFSRLPISKSLYYLYLKEKICSADIDFAEIDFLLEIANNHVDIETRIATLFLLARVMRSKKFIDDERSCLKAGNQLAYNYRNFNDPNLEKVVERFTNGTFKQMEQKCNGGLDPDIVLIFGPSSSGKTTIQNQIASYKSVKKYDECLSLSYELNALFPKYSLGSKCVEIERDVLIQKKNQLSSALELSANKTNIFTNPNNIIWAPLINLVFPNAVFQYANFNSTEIQNRIYEKYYAHSSKELFSLSSIHNYISDHNNLKKVMSDIFKLQIHTIENNQR
ncbi:hypothetical protein N9M38_03335 [Planktomarina temperata]|nr:hypothetical protein [Planktomarina temperata]